ncbi:pyridoxamine 5'-phosphate oxidase family protein [Granulicoccus sp. GXG6511]|uniref:pyridoxamine 5'-phosphate oxidase family protein n=1 Tax=Granulicoccus sp. GXG6511 TaxID=3381351 RepID=UPI003D7D5EF4
MATFYPSIEPQLADFIGRQHMFFVATAAPTGRVNVSPKGLDTFRVLSPHRVAWLNGTGSGNETAAHTQQDPRMTIMFCSVEGKPWILRLYGRARMIQPGDVEWAEACGWFPPLEGARQVFVVDVDECQTSCGFGVPLYDYAGQRDLMAKWADNKGPEGILDYQRKKNERSIDGFDAGLRQA